MIHNLLHSRLTNIQTSGHFSTLLFPPCACIVFCSTQPRRFSNSHGTRWGLHTRSMAKSLVIILMRSPGLSKSHPITFCVHLTDTSTSCTHGLPIQVKEFLAEGHEGSVLKYGEDAGSLISVMILELT
ncbi:hypothetical protein PILCRDRAFT_547493 [Piloderma croceum F 1598]|uniref:Uncharacterized protein n=1 Tax=Piloderma croceum (strain F 1598) TaxID=765440 RepID=A0A0C3FK28_PILCF|nr:hypothetical protein PILCRDRAFT_547493 [Piloderma croceum F 1598]